MEQAEWTTSDRIMGEVFLLYHYKCTHADIPNENTIIVLGDSGRTKNVLLEGRQDNASQIMPRMSRNKLEIKQSGYT